MAKLDLRLAKQTSLKKRLHVPAAIENAVHQNVLSTDLVNDTVRLEVNFPVCRYPDSIELRWNMPALW